MERLEPVPVINTGSGLTDGKAGTPAATAQDAQSRPASQARMSAGMWAVVLVLVLTAGTVLLLRGGSPTPGPGPAPVRDVASVVEAAQRQFATANAEAMSELAAAVESGELTTWVQVQARGQELTAAGRAAAFASIDELDTAASAQADGVIAGREREVANYFRAKAEGHRRAAR